jgi:AcrR family transcriptional regulator
VQSIVDEAHLTKGAFYHHFSSKEDLLVELHNTFIDYQIELMNELMTRNPTPEEAVRAFLSDLLFDVAAKYQREIRIFFQESKFLSEDAFAAVRDKRDQLDRFATEIIERGIADGSFRDDIGPARLTAFAMIGMGSWAYHWLEPDGPIAPAAIADMYADIFLRGIAL